MYAYSNYNQIIMDSFYPQQNEIHDRRGNFYYNIVPLGLKIMDTMFQRMMNKVFKNQIWDMLEFYMEDMIIKPEDKRDNTIHL